MTDFTHSLAILIGIDAYTGGIPRLTTAADHRGQRRGAAGARYKGIVMDAPVGEVRLGHNLNKRNV